MINFEPIVAGIFAGLISKRGLITGFVMGIISGFIVLLYQQITGATPLIKHIPLAFYSMKNSQSVVLQPFQVLQGS